MTDAACPWWVPRPGFPLRVLAPDATSRALAGEVRALFGSGGALAGQTRSDASGAVINLEPGDHPALGRVAAHLAERAGFPPEVELTFRYRRYAPGLGHPPHLDTYEEEGRKLVATFTLSLADGVQGGETLFPRAPGGPIAAGHVRGMLVWWDVADSEGRPEERTWHAAREVRAGVKEVLLAFAWRRDHGAWAPAAVTDVAPADAEGQLPVGPDTFPLPLPADALAAEACPGLFCIQDTAPADAVRALRTAAAHRAVDFHLLQARSLDLWHADALPQRSLLVQVSTSLPAIRAVERLWHPGVATLHDDPLGPLANHPAQARVLECAGLPVAPWAPLVRSDREGLARLATALGGYPLVLRFGGGSGGVGTVRVDSPAAFHSLAEYARSRGQVPDVKRYLRARETWRVAVVDGRVVGACRLRVPQGDFRTELDDSDDAFRPAPAPLQELALRAALALRLGAAGVDLLVDEDERAWVLEANAPFHFGHHQERGEDIAGAIVEALLRRAARLPA